AWGAEFAAFIAAETARQQAEAERRLLPPPASLQSEREHLATLAVRVEAEVTSLRERLAAAEAKLAPEHDADEVGAAYTQLHDALHERAGSSLSLAERAFLLEIEGAVRAALEAAGHLAPEPPLSPEVRTVHAQDALDRLYAQVKARVLANPHGLPVDMVMGHRQDWDLFQAEHTRRLAERED
ncbi:MAG: hypothetical protein ACXWWN_08480, partial [Gemmatimonadales bacterium]